MFKVRYNNVTLKGLKDQLDGINQGLNLGDTRRVEYIRYGCPMLDDGRITFSRLELTNDDDVRSLFSIFWQHNMFPWINMFVMLLKSPGDILNSLIPPEDYDYVVSLFCWNLSLILVSLLKMLVSMCRILMIEICRFVKKSKNEENTTCIPANQLYRFSHRIPSYMMSVMEGNAPLRGSFELNRAPLSIETCQLAGR